MFNVLVAPVIFSRLWEYPLALVLACFFRPWPAEVRPGRRRLFWPLRALGLGLMLVIVTAAFFMIRVVPGVLRMVFLALRLTDPEIRSTYSALSRRQDGSFEVIDTKLRLVPPGGRLVFLDVNGDSTADFRLLITGDAGDGSSGLFL